MPVAGRAHGRCGRAYPAEPAPWVDERETGDRAAHRARGGHRRLVDLDVASLAARHPRRADEPAPPADRSPCRAGSTPGGSRRSTARCCACEIVALARADDGGAVSSYEMQQRGRRARRARPGRSASRRRRLLGPRGLTGRAPVNLVPCWTRATASSRATLLITLTGKDRPGVTSMVFDTLARFGVEVLDIEQIVLRRRLILGLLVSSPRDWKPLRAEHGAGRRPTSA